MVARYAKDRRGRTPREYVLERLVHALGDPACPAGDRDQEDLMDMVLDVTGGDTILVRGMGAALNFFTKGRRRCRSFSEHLAQYLDGLTPVAKSRLFAEARRRRGVKDGSSNQGAG